MIGICSYGAYIPFSRLRRDDMIQPGSAFTGPGERSVANYDEDTLTMSVEALFNCLEGFDHQSINALFFASTTAPFVEKQTASIAAAVTDLNEGIFTVDINDSLRGGTSALRLAADTIKAGSAKRVLVAAADCRLGQPLSTLEQNCGDGAGALMIGDSNVAVSIEGVYSLSSDFIDYWRPADDKFVHIWQERFGITSGYTPTIQKAINEAMKKYGLTAKDFAKAVFNAPDARSHATVGKALGFSAAQIQSPLFDVMGNTGTAFPLMLLIATLENAKAGDKILLASYGDGADVFILQVTPEIEKLRNRRSIKRYLKSKKMLPNYLKYLRLRHLFPTQIGRMSDVIPGLSQQWRERDSLMKLHGSKCKQCGWIEYPILRICPKCHSKDNFEQVRLKDKKATIYSFSTDGVPLMPVMTDPPVVRTIVSFEGGGMHECEMTEGNVDELEIGMPLDMVLRKLERQGDVPAYSWKTRVVR